MNTRSSTLERVAAATVVRSEFTTTGVTVWFADGTVNWFSHDQLAELRRPFTR
jgi:hypothetical protein